MISFMKLYILDYCSVTKAIYLNFTSGLKYLFRSRNIKTSFISEDFTSPASNYW